jgi:hypothetical protein
MLTTKLVIRIMDAQNQLLGWAEATGEAKGDGKIWVDAPTRVMIEQTGIPHLLSVHWCDVNVEIRSLVEQKKPLAFGNVLELPGQWPAITCGPAAGGLPPVTVRDPVSIGIPVGALGARTH